MKTKITKCIYCNTIMLNTLISKMYCSNECKNGAKIERAFLRHINSKTYLKGKSSYHNKIWFAMIRSAN